MGNVIANINKGRFAYYATLPAAADALIMLLLVSTGLQSDDLLMDHDDVGAMLAASNDEATATNYARKTISASVTVTVDDTNNRVDVDIPDQVFTNLGGATNNTIGKACIAYDNDTGAGTDANIAPISYHDLTLTTDGSTVTIQIDPAGFARAA